MPTWFLAPIAGLKLSSQATQAGGIDSLESIIGHIKSLKFGLRIEIFILGLEFRRSVHKVSPVFLAAMKLAPKGGAWVGERVVGGTTCCLCKN